MNKTTLSLAALLDITLDYRGDEPLYAQLVQALRGVILAGRIVPGAKLPSSRSYARELSVSRVTIVTAYEQLIAEGYLKGRHGSGVFVVDGLPDDILQVKKYRQQQKSIRPPVPPLRPFQTNSPDMRMFPHQKWARLFQRLWSNPQSGLIADQDPLGWWPLRQEIASHLMNWRGIDCQAGQVVITSGARESIRVIADALLEPEDRVACEDPGYDLFSRVLSRAGIAIDHVPVDNEGMQVDVLNALKPQPRCAIITPSRQYPLGVTMPLLRRLQLLKWARSVNGFIVEDDYDSEYRYTGQPLPALSSLEQQSPVIYLGSFSKVFSKSLRLGYLVVPDDMITKVSAFMSKEHPGAALLAQPVLAQFMADGDYASHIRRMRRIYAQRQQFFFETARILLHGLIEFSKADGGMHLVGRIGTRLKGKLSDVEICRRAEQNGISITPLSSAHHSVNGREGIIAGYAGFSETELEAALVKLAACLETKA